MKRMEENKEGIKDGLEEGEIQHGSSRGESSSLSNGIANSNTSGSASDSASETPVKLEKDSMRPRNSMSPGELTRGTKMEPADPPHSECIGGGGLADHHHSMTDRMSGARLGSHHSSHLSHAQLQGHGLSLQGQGLCGVTGSSLPLPPDPMSPIESSVSNFSVENFLSPAHLANGGDMGSSSSSTLSSRPPPLISPHILPYSRSSELYRPGTACSQAASPPASAYNYHCGSGSAPSSSGYPSASTPHISSSHGQQPNNGLSGHHHHGVMNMSNSNTSSGSTGGGSSHGCSEETTGSPHASSHSHGGHSSHLSPHSSSLHQTNGLSPSVFSSMSQHKDFTYPRANGWYMNPAAAAELNPGPSDFSSFPGMTMRDMFQNSASCQLAAFRAPSYKTSATSYYDCSKY